MDTTARETQVAEQPARVAASVRHSRRRRRPSGAPPPLPRHLETTGVGWLLAAVGLVTVFTASFVASRHGAAVAVTAADDRVARWLTGLRSGWRTNALQAAAFPASWLASNILAWCIVVPLLVFKRIRHLVVYVVALALTSQLVIVLSAALKRPRPFGVVIDGSWNGCSMPSVRSRCWPPAWSASSTPGAQGPLAADRQVGGDRDRRPGRAWPGSRSASTPRPTCCSARSSG